LIETASMRAGNFTGSFFCCEPLAKSSFGSIRKDQSRLWRDWPSCQLSQFNGGGYIILFPQLETDALPMRVPAQLPAAFEHQVGMIVSLTQMGKDYAAQPVMMYGFEQTAGFFV
jgi:hypothetical protein